MRVFLLTYCLLIGWSVSAQTFQWNDEPATPPTPTQTPTIQEPITGDETGMAHFYPDHYAGKITASGEVFQQELFTAAHPKLPLGTIVKVVRTDNGLSTTVRINDRGAYCDECIIDLSRAAAEEIDLTTAGRAKVAITVLESARNTAANDRIIPPPAERQLTARGVGGGTSITYEKATQDLQPKRPPVDYQPTGPVLETQLQARGSSSLSAPVKMENGIPIIQTPISPYTVQLGSYAKYSNAERHVRRLQEKGFENVYLLQEEQTDYTLLNRVIVAPFQSLEDAEDYVDDLQEYYQMEALVFQARMVEVSE